MNAALFGNFMIFIRMFKVKNLIILHKLPLGLVTVHFPCVRILLLYTCNALFILMLFFLLNVLLLPLVFAKYMPY